MKYDVFISYSRKDSATADIICQALDKAGISYFIDKQGINGGFEFPAILANAIIESRIILFLASKNSYQSKFTNAELTFAFNEKPKNCIMPYIIDGSELPTELRFVFSNINWRRIHDCPIETSLMEELKTMLQGKISPQQQLSKPKVKQVWLYTLLIATVMTAVGIYYSIYKKDLGITSISTPTATTATTTTTAKTATTDTTAKKATTATTAKTAKTAKTATTAKTIKTATTSTYHIGDYYNANGLEGIIFDIDNTGKHGKILSLQQTIERTRWYEGEDFKTESFGAKSRISGIENFQKIKQQPEWEKRFPAFTWCSSLGKQWYLPAIEELKLFTENKDVIDAVNATLKQHDAPLLYDIGEVTTYWSSTESTDRGVWTVVMTIGKANPYITRDNISHVRAIANF